MDLDRLPSPHFWSELPFGHRWVSKVSKRDFFSLIWSIIWQICGDHCICASSICKVIVSAFCIYKGRKATKIDGSGSLHSMRFLFSVQWWHTGKKVWEVQILEPGWKSGLCIVIVLSWSKKTPIQIWTLGSLNLHSLSKCFYLFPQGSKEILTFCYKLNFLGIFMDM